jgi:hypothetical protein
MQSDASKAAAILGRIKSDKKAKASRENGKKGGYRTTKEGKLAYKPNNQHKEDVT